MANFDDFDFTSSDEEDLKRFVKKRHFHKKYNRWHFYPSGRVAQKLPKSSNILKKYFLYPVSFIYFIFFYQRCASARASVGLKSCRN